MRDNLIKLNPNLVDVSKLREKVAKAKRQQEPAGLQIVKSEMCRLL